jgi:hypothetical protein
VRAGGKYREFRSGLAGFWLVRVQSPLAYLELDPTQLSFDTIQVGDHDFRMFGIHNTGNLVLHVSQITSPLGFTTDITGDLTIGSGGERDVFATFEPTEAGTFDGTIWVYSTASNSPTGVQVHGVGAANDADDPGTLLPTTVTLSPAYPNPFNPSTMLQFTLPNPGAVRLSIYDSGGREVTLLADRVSPRGRYTVTFDGSHLASGVYFARLEVATVTITRRMVLLK